MRLTSGFSTTGHHQRAAVAAQVHVGKTGRWRRACAGFYRRGRRRSCRRAGPACTTVWWPASIALVALDADRLESGRRSRHRLSCGLAACAVARRVVDTGRRGRCFGLLRFGGRRIGWRRPVPASRMRRRAASLLRRWRSSWIGAEEGRRSLAEQRDDDATKIPPKGLENACGPAHVFPGRPATLRRRESARGFEDSGRAAGGLADFTGCVHGERGSLAGESRPGALPLDQAGDSGPPAPDLFE